MTWGPTVPPCGDPEMPVEHHLLVAFVVTTIIAMVAPGPDMLFVLGCGMRGGPRAGLRTVHRPGCAARRAAVTRSVLYSLAASRA
jgi:threonine/homoserine/homoserine lactone efflux protein